MACQHCAKRIPEHSNLTPYMLLDEAVVEKRGNKATMEWGWRAWLGLGLRGLAWVTLAYSALLFTFTLIFWGEWRNTMERFRDAQREREVETLFMAIAALCVAMAIYALSVSFHLRFRNFGLALASAGQLLMRDLASFVTSLMTIGGLLIFVTSGLVDKLDGGERLIAATVGFTLFNAGVFVRRWAKRKAAPTAAELLRADPRAPVLYLRAFKDDAAMSGVTFRELYQPFITGRELSEEEQLATVVRDIGPLIAVADPGAPFQNVGAAKASYADDEWQESVQQLLAEAGLVLIRVSPTDFVYWEIEQAWRIAGSEKTIFLFGSRSAAVDFKQRFEALTGLSVNIMPKLSADSAGSVGLAVRLSADGDVRSAPINPVGFWRRRFAASALPQYKAALSQLDERIKPPPLNWSLIVGLGMWPVLIAVLGLWSVFFGAA